MTEVTATTPVRPSRRRPGPRPAAPTATARVDLLPPTTVDGSDAPVLVGFPPGTRLSAHASWFSGDGDLVAVVDAGRPDAAHESVLADALAWQGDRRLVLVVPAEDAWTYAARAAWVRTPVSVMASPADGVAPELVACSQDDVLAELAGQPPVPVEDLGLGDGHQGWLAELVRHEALDGTTAVPQGGSVTWMRDGLEVLRVTSRGDGLLVAPGLRLRHRTDPRRRPFVLRGPLTDSELQDVAGLIAHDLRVHSGVQARVGRLRRADDAASRLAADLARHPALLGLDDAERAVAGPDRPVDLLGHAGGALHVAAVSVGSDPSVVLRGLDHLAWTRAHRRTLAEDRGWPVEDDVPVHLHLVLAAPDRAHGRVPAVSGHVAPQVEALVDDVPVAVHVVQGWAQAFDGSEVPDLRELALRDLWVPRGGLVARPVQQRRARPVVTPADGGAPGWGGARLG